jgi:hypothetical protein
VGGKRLLSPSETGLPFQPAIIHWNGTNWSNFMSPTPNPHNSVSMVNANDGWAVGDEGTIIHWNGTSWNNVTSPLAGLRSVLMVSANYGWAVGFDGVIIRWNGTDWSEVASPTYEHLTSVSMVNANDGWAVGLGGTIIRLTGTGTAGGLPQFTIAVIVLVLIVSVSTVPVLGRRALNRRKKSSMPGG